MIGEKYGKWLIQGEIFNHERPGRQMKCVCECGRIAVLPANTLRAGRSTQCKNCMYEERFKPNAMIGKKFGKWTVISFLGVRNRCYFYETLCKCGKSGKHYGSDLKARKSLQCIDCHNRDLAKRKYEMHGGSKTETYNIWKNMLRRCLNPKDPHYDRYGGRGITLCPRWNIYSEFLADMGERPDRMELDRIDNDGNYCPENCRWVTHRENCLNRDNSRCGNSKKRTKHIFTHEGKTQSAAQWAKELGLHYSTFLRHIPKGIEWVSEYAKERSKLLCAPAPSLVGAAS